MSPAPWREASSLIIVAKCATEPGTSEDPDSQTDYRLMLTKRSGKSSYLANAFCFPGGHIELADFGSNWWPIFESQGHDRASVRSVTAEIAGPRPPIFAESLALKKFGTVNAEDLLPSDIALRISAIRETFEETGVLLAYRRKSNGPALIEANDPKMKQWQKEIHDDATKFAQMFSDLDACPDLWSLKEWWNWLTPEALGHKRFDTMFYVACIDRVPNVQSDQNEVSIVEWHSPQYVLKLHADADSFLAPPQVYELARLANFTSYSHIKANRERHGVHRWCAKITGLKDGAILALPGDDFYDTVITSSGATLPSLEDIRNKCRVMNRMELRAPVFTPICAHLVLPCGQLCPVACPLPTEAAAALQSQL